MWKLNATERLFHWRTFRKSLNVLLLEPAVKAIAEFWASCPFTPYYLDPEDYANWPDPWTLIEENYYCDVAKALGILYTIKLTNHTPVLEMRVYCDRATNTYYNLVWVDNGKYVLNMVNGEVVNRIKIENELELCKVYGEQELKLSSY
jgi:hypothetical protein